MWYITELHSDSTHVQNTHAVSYIFMTHYVIRAPGMWLAHSRCWPVVFLLSTDPSVLPSPSSLQLKNTKTQTFFTRLVWWEKLTWTKARLSVSLFHPTDVNVHTFLHRNIHVFDYWSGPGPPQLLNIHCMYFQIRSTKSQKHLSSEKPLTQGQMGTYWQWTQLCRGSSP